MITRPLDLASRLAPPPRNFDVFFYVNVPLIVLFFSLFYSRFVLAPGLGVDFRLPVFAGAGAGGRPTDIVIAVRSADMILVEETVLKLSELKPWLLKQSAGRSGQRLLVQVSAALPTKDTMSIADMATEAGFVVQIAAEPPAEP